MKPTTIRAAWIVVAVLVVNSLGSSPSFAITCEAFNPELTVVPAQPGCDEEITIEVSVDLPDTCWSAPPPELFPIPFAFWFLLPLFYDDDGTCALIITPISFNDTIGPLESGPYTFGTQYVLYQGGESTSCFATHSFDVYCCDDLPAAVSNLRLAKVSSATEVKLTWDDVPGAADYIVFAETEPDVVFDFVLDTTTSAAHGVTQDLSSWPAFFLVTARNDCGAGPLH